MFITAYKEIVDLKNNPSCEVQVNIENMIMGTPSFKQVVLSKDTLEDRSVEVTSVLNPLDLDKAQTSQTVFSFAFTATGDDADFQRYITARKEALGLYDAVTLFSCKTLRGDGWNYDTFELIQFPKPENLQQLMSDERYNSSKEVIESTKIFGDGVVSIACLEFR
jgi:hypothetical protein